MKTRSYNIKESYNIFNGSATLMEDIVWRKIWKLKLWPQKSPRFSHKNQVGKYWYGIDYNYEALMDLQILNYSLKFPNIEHLLNSCSFISYLWDIKDNVKRGPHLLSIGHRERWCHIYYFKMDNFCFHTRCNKSSMELTSRIHIVGDMEGEEWENFQWQ